MRPAPSSSLAALVALLSLLFAAGATHAASRVAQFTPTGSVKAPRQVQARFESPMVRFGDPRVASPFDVDCAAPGRGRWVDSRNWVYDFDAEPPGGLRCRFTLRAGLTDAAGRALGGTRSFAFDTGGPSILQSEPWEGSQIDEEQIFLLGLDAAASRASIEAHAHCRADGIVEAIEVEVLEGDARQAALAANPWFLRRYAAALLQGRYESELVARSAADEPAVRARYEALLDGPASTVVALRCRQRLPNGAKAWLDWGAGIATPGGAQGATPQTLAWTVRPEFEATFSCQRMHRNAQCIPVLGMRLSFSAPIARESAAAIRLLGPDGRRHAPTLDGDARDAYVSGLQFKGPLPARSTFTLQLPPALVDDAGRPLANQHSFPLKVATDDDPPLAKFAANFGIVELHGDAALPVTVRNLEPNILRRAPDPAPPPPSLAGFVNDLTRRALRIAEPAPEAPLALASIRGRVLKLPADDIAAVAGWFSAVEAARRDQYAWLEEKQEYGITRRAGETEVLRKARDATLLEVPRAAPARDFEVIGIPLREPGFHVVELASPRLGAELFGREGTYFVQSLALVTNLGVHLKLGRESSLVWVTALDSGKPVAGADVSIKDCAGATHWQGSTDAQGIARVEVALPTPEQRPACDWNPRGLVAVARVGDDVGLVASHWNDGIATWQFGLPLPGGPAPRLVSTIFDRTLLQRGETVHMKHVLRHHGGAGFAHWSPESLEFRLRHEGSNDEFTLRAEADAATGSGTSTWTVPVDAKLGTYQLELRDGEQWMAAGSFRVEAFRVPLLRAEVQPRGLPVVGDHAVGLDVQINYQAGGPAGGLPIKIRGALRQRPLAYPDYPDFTFMNGDVREGVTEHAEQAWSALGAADAGDEALPTRAANLDAQGGARVTLAGGAARDTPASLVADVEYQDPNGETLSTTTTVPVWPSRIVLGLKPEGWALNQARFRFQAVALDLDGEPLPDVAISVDLFRRSTLSHRKRLVGGFYAYENRTETRRLEVACEGRTDAQGLLDCEASSPVSGSVVLRASALDAEGRRSVAHREIWIAAGEEWWYAVADHDRMDLIPERKRYEPGETARLQVRMPFREAQALVTVEREGVLESFVTTLSGKSPVIELPVRGQQAPNVFVSVLTVRGRDAAVQPTALVDLGRPAYKLGMAELRVGWRTHQLDVKVVPARKSYRVREEALVDVEVTRADGRPLGADAEIALAAVDEGLLELRPNESWALLDSMMGRRGIEVQTATAQMQVIGRRHYGRKAVAPGGGGGSGGGGRALFDTLLSWQPKVKLDARGRARLSVPLNDSLTSFRIVAVATSGAGHFGTGAASIRTSQDLMLFSGLPPVVRGGDRYRAMFTVRNAGERPLETRVRAAVALGDAPALALPEQGVALEPGAAREIAWDYTAPAGTGKLRWTVDASGDAADVTDSLSVTQQLLPAVPVRTLQATLAQLREPLSLPVARPADALPARGGVEIGLSPRLVDSLDGVRRHMAAYPYRCLEQRASRAVALQDQRAWDALMAELPAHLDGDGLAKYFAAPGPGSDVLSSYLLALAAEAEWAIPEAARQRLRAGLVGFIEGRVSRDSPLETADLVLRKLAAIEALGRYPEGIDPGWLESLDLTPALWPTSAVIDYVDILRRQETLPRRDARLAAALRELRTRFTLQGGALRHAGGARDALWWLMRSPDLIANRALLSVLARKDWAEDLPRLVKGSLGQQRNGHWDTTPANAWGVLALKRFSAQFEATAVSGRTRAAIGGTEHVVDWGPDAIPPHTFEWPAGPASLSVSHAGAGAPWVAVQSRAAVPLREPLFAGFRITRSVTPLEQRMPGRWQRGDRYRVRLDIAASSDMTWVVVSDPLPAGAVALAGAGMPDGAARPLFEEREQDVYRAYFDYVPQGGWRLEYTVRVNNAGEFQLPPTRVEAMYAPDMFGELPNAAVTVDP
jgi:uncharacterized protein YfaS (alpha-2-macroglobulin family)